MYFSTIYEDVLVVYLWSLYIYTCVVKFCSCSCLLCSTNLLVLSYVVLVAGHASTWSDNHQSTCHDMYSVFFGQSAVFLAA